MLTEGIIESLNRLLRSVGKGYFVKSLDKQYSEDELFRWVIDICGILRIDIQDLINVVDFSLVQGFEDFVIGDFEESKIEMDIFYLYQCDRREDEIFYDY